MVESLLDQEESSEHPKILGKRISLQDPSDLKEEIKGSIEVGGTQQPNQNINRNQ